MATPAFLKHSSTDFFIDFDANIEPTILSFAHKDANYLIEMTRSIESAWGPLVPNKVNYLYWDVNLISGEITRGITIIPIMYSGSPPPDPVFDQHWFDMQTTTMKVWNGRKWLDAIRVFAAEATASSITSYAQSSSQAGIVNGEYHTGNILYDVYGKPLRQSDGTFATSSSQFTLSNTSSKSVKLEGDLFAAQADEPIPAFSLVRQISNKKIKLATYADVYCRICGIITTDLYPGEVGYIIANGLIKNKEWNFPPQKIGKPVFCGPFGAVSLNPPKSGVLQIIGYIYDVDSINMNIQQVIILDSIAPMVDVIPTLVKKPVADFTPSVTVGTVPLSVKFVNTTMNGATSFIWDFIGDGTVGSMEKDPLYLYADPGTYTVSLTATNQSGSNTIIKQQIISVIPKPIDSSTPNLGISIGTVAQARAGAEFDVTINTMNAGLAIATNVVQVIRIPNVLKRRVEVPVVPAGASISWDGDVTTIILPTLNSLSSVKSAFSKIIVKSPPNQSQVNIYADVTSSQVDKFSSDNSAAVRVEIIE